LVRTIGERLPRAPEVAAKPRAAQQRWRERQKAADDRGVRGGGSGTKHPREALPSAARATVWAPHSLMASIFNSEQIALALPTTGRLRRSGFSALCQQQKSGEPL